MADKLQNGHKNDIQSFIIIICHQCGCLRKICLKGILNGVYFNLCTFFPQYCKYLYIVHMSSGISFYAPVIGESGAHRFWYVCPQMFLNLGRDF